MSKKLLAAVFAAAFLVTGGVARATDTNEAATSTTGASITDPIAVTGGNGLGLTSGSVGSTVTVTVTSNITTTSNGHIYIGAQSAGDGATESTASSNTVAIVTSGDLVIGTDATANPYGGVTVTATGTLKVTGDSSSIGEGGLLHIKGATHLGDKTAADAATSGKLTNSGTILLGAATTLTVEQDIENNGRLDLSAGTLAIDDNDNDNVLYKIVNKATAKDKGVRLAATQMLNDDSAADVWGAVIRGADTVGTTGLYDMKSTVITGDIDDDARDILKTTVGAGIITIDTAQTKDTTTGGAGHTKTIDVNGADVNLTAVDTTGNTGAKYSADIKANNIYAGASDNNRGDYTVLSGTLTTGENGALIINNGTNATNKVFVEWDSKPVPTPTPAPTEVVTTGVNAVQIGETSEALGQYSTLRLALDANLTNAPVTNYGTFDANGKLLTLGTYNAGGIIDNSKSNEGSLADGVKTAYDNASLDNIITALKANKKGQLTAQNEIDNVIITGDVDTAFALKDADKIEDGAITLGTIQTKGGSFNLGKNVDLYSNGGTIGAVTAAAHILGDDAVLNQKQDAAVVMNIVKGSTNSLDPTKTNTGTVTLTKDSGIVKGDGNDIFFEQDDNTLVNNGVIDLSHSSSTAPLENQGIDFNGLADGTTGSVINNGDGGKMILGEKTWMDGVANGQGTINNFVKDASGNILVGDIDVSGSFDSNGNGMGDFIKTIQNSLDAQKLATPATAEIGNININSTLKKDFDLTKDGLNSSLSYSNNLPTSGTVTLSNQTQTAKASVNVAQADVNLDNDSNTLYMGDVNAKNITFTNKTGKQDATYTGVMTATKGDILIEDGGVYKGTFVTADEVNSSTGEVETAHGTLLKRDGTATFNGTTFNTHYQAGIGSLSKVTGADVKVVNNGSIETLRDATIEFGELTTKSSGSDQILAKIQGDTTTNSTSFIDLDPTTNLTVELNAARKIEDTGASQQVFDSAAWDSVDDTKALQGILDRSSLTTIYEKGTWWQSDGTDGFDRGVYYWHELADNPYDSIDDVLEDQGISQYRGMISDQTLESQFAIAGLYADRGTAYGDLSRRDQYLVDTFNIASGYTVDGYSLSGAKGTGYNPDEAYAIEQWKNGADWAGAVEAVTDTVRNFNRAITNRAYNIGHLLNAVEYDECGNVINSCGGFKNRLWAGYTGQWDKLDDRGWDKGYKYDAHGFNVGYDHVTSSGVGFGAAFGYSKGDYKNYGQLYGDKSKIDNYSFGLFASYNHCSGFFTTLSGTYTYSKYKMHNGFTDYGRGAGYDNAKFHGSSWSVGGKMGYDYSPVANLTITPTVGLYYYSSRTNTFDSTYRNNMRYSRHTLEAPIDVTVKYDIAVGCDSTLSLMGTAGYAYNFNNKGTKINGFTMGDNLNYEFGDHRMTKPGRSSWNVGGGAQFRYKNVDFGVHYEYYGRKDFRSHNLNANVGYSF